MVDTTKAPAAEAAPAPLTGLEALIRDPEVDPEKLADALLEAQHPNIGQLQQRLPFVSDKPGWDRYWFRSDRVPFALSQGWRFVPRSAIHMISTGLGFGNTALGDNVEVPAGRSEITEEGKASKLHLMEIPKRVAQVLRHNAVTLPTQEIENALRGAGGVGNHIDPSQMPFRPKTAPGNIDPIVRSSLT